MENTSYKVQADDSFFYIQKKWKEFIQKKGFGFTWWRKLILGKENQLILMQTMTHSNLYVLAVTQNSTWYFTADKLAEAFKKFQKVKKFL